MKIVDIVAFVCIRLLFVCINIFIDISVFLLNCVYICISRCLFSYFKSRLELACTISNCQSNVMFTYVKNYGFIIIIVIIIIIIIITLIIIIIIIIIIVIIIIIIINDNNNTELSGNHKMVVTIMKTTSRKLKPKIINYGKYKHCFNDTFRDALSEGLCKVQINNDGDGFNIFLGIC